MNKMGFGFLRQPTAKSGDIDYAQLNEMTDAFLAAGAHILTQPRGGGETILVLLYAERWIRYR